MKTIVIDIEIAQKAKEFLHLLKDMTFVSRVSVVDNKKSLIAALTEHEQFKKSMIKKKNKAIAKYL